MFKRKQKPDLSYQDRQRLSRRRDHYKTVLVLILIALFIWGVVLTEGMLLVGAIITVIVVMVYWFILSAFRGEL